ncbi:hypothetical protein B5C34_12370 [Pacificimonas flava]|uniref:DUF2062 domain-containing protein n=2 Tax=Pacificimonas TaxID=1960290 RepID=A0A219B734_9SPHN|nr:MULTISPECIES: DUF2062 domain-containing protein [Pacificimonas]MBZ6378539.1 DUF2062 domain-containing protein [Pacificimonas aurantium]OWV34175.1 hypothetical protein B5C34_12370 [Pacificimonas flava]
MAGHIGRFIQRYVPTREHLAGNRFLRPVSRYVGNPNVWHFNRHSVARGVALGLFLGFAIPMGLQLIVAALTAVSTRANLAVTALFTSVSNPFTVVPIYFAALKTGDWLLGYRERPHPGKEQLLDIIAGAPVPMLVGGVFFAAISAAVGFLAVHFAWRWWVARRWRARLARHRAAA